MSSTVDAASLPMAAGASGWERQRATASRNEQSILAATIEILRAAPDEDLDVRAVAAAAGVGVGTVYRRFGDKAGLIAAVLGEPERELQEAVLSGPPPLGPGAPAPERLEAFLLALCALTEEHMDVLAASEAAAQGARHRVGSYAAWRLHVAVLLRQTDQRLDADWLADLLLAPLAAALYRHQRRDHGMTAARIADNLVAAAQRVTRPTGG